MTPDTLCWNCNHAHDIADPFCVKCGATNPNVDLDKAQAEALGEREIELPALLRRQAA